MTKPIAIIHEFDWLFADDENRGNRAKAKGVIGSRQYERLEKYLRREAGRGNAVDQMVRFGRHEGKNAIQVLNYVGVIRFADGAQIEVLPKIELSGSGEDVTRKIFLKMLRALLNFEDKAKVGGRAHVDDSRMRVFDVFVRRFLDDVAELVKRGLKGGYSTVSGNERFFKGKLNVAENIRQNIVHRERFFVEYDVFSSDTPENRLIRTTLERLRTEVGDAGCWNDINRLLPVFEEVPRSINVDADLLAAKAVRTSGLYRAVVDWCDVFLMHRGFAAFSGSHDVQTLLFPMEKLFEAYVAHVVRKYASPEGWRVSAQEHGKCLFSCQGADRFILKPDIVLRKDDQIIIADTKWKRLNRDECHAGVSQSDMYQMYAYGKRYAESGEEGAKQKARAVHLIYPRREEVVGNEYSDNKGLCVKIDLFDFDKPGGDSRVSTEQRFVKSLLGGVEQDNE